MPPATLLLQLALLAIPASVHAQSCSTSTAKSCSTQMAMVPNWWPVGTVSRTSLAPGITQTTTPVVTVTSVVPAIPLTATVSSNVVVTSTTTAIPQTATTYLTSTVFATTSSVTISTTTGVVTQNVLSTVTNLQTALVPAPSNFMNAYDTSGDTNYAGTKRAIDRRHDFAARVAHDSKRGLLASWLNAISTGSIPASNKGFSSKKRAIALQSFNNPIAVNCVVTLQKVCGINAKPTTKTLTSTGAASTTTTTILSTITSVSTVIPPASTITVYTSTVTSTLTQLTTVIAGATSTLTQVSTVTATSTTSVYAACATNNVLGPRLNNGYAINKVYFYDDQATVATSQQTSAYDCCVACQTSNLCQFYQYSGNSGRCYVTGQNANWCPNNQQDASWPAYFVWDDPAKVTDALSIGNGACGITMDLGQDNGQ